MKIICPSCGIKTEFSNNKYRPFCSKECKNRDFVNWAGELYKIPSKGNQLEQDNTEINEDTFETIA
jgi:hypothetical protein